MLYTMVRTPTPGQFTAPIPLLTHAANPPKKVVPDVSLIQAVSTIFHRCLQILSYLPQYSIQPYGNTNFEVGTSLLTQVC